jgi:hypothetical protein
MHQAKDQRADDAVDVFVQGEGKQHITIVRIALTATIQQLVVEAERLGLIDPTHGAEINVFLEEGVAALRPEESLKAAGVVHRGRVHLHRCRRVVVAVHFNGAAKEETFPPAATVLRAFQWAVGPRGFSLAPTDAVEHVLQVAGSSTRPDEDAHLGTLTMAPECAVFFDLVAKRRVEG